ncbi:hypothetical protein HF086_006963 [Spodoptera exigua]|uniref:BPTI/Kunitz inhibitor domain-containing protein n=1 Tax=Spodoptera exigua TaxID=7107 RepID=A0A922MIE9_SPOEX|nr:hypothetical protein HF086_006963 [Spodoptera exigua]
MVLVHIIRLVFTVFLYTVIQINGNNLTTEVISTKTDKAIAADATTKMNLHHTSQILRETKDELKFLDYTIHCKFQPNTYSCKNIRKPRKYYFDIQLKQCVRFEYGHCKQSYNMFDGKRECLSACKDDYSHAVKNVSSNVFCRFQPDFGDCHSYYPMWYYDINEMRCRGFSFSGCGGNYNRFHKIGDCISVCGPAVKHV